MEGADTSTVSTTTTTNSTVNTTTINANTINPKAIKAAQEEISKLDIHVCGQCHSVFHFIDEFQEHRTKDGGCTKRSSLRDNSTNEQKAQVWAFLLWKDTQIQNDSPDKENTWKLYQKWCKMDTHVRDCWIMAGKTIQTFTKIGNAKMQDVGRHQGTILTEGGKTVVVRKLIRNGQPESPNKIKTEMKIKSEPLEKGKVKLRPSIKPKPSNETGENNGETSDEEYVVEKILAKRFNPKKKVYEYLLKWEGYAHEYNTWEEVNNVSATCKQLMDEFEKNLAKQKELKAQQVAKSINRTQITVGQKLVKVENVKPGPSSAQASRPMRSSKSKAMDQVKQWCGTMKDEDSEQILGKRKITFSDSESDDGLAGLSTIKRNKLDTSGDDDWTADSEEDKIVIGRSDVIQRAFNRANSQSNGTNRGHLSGSDLAKGLLKSDVKTQQSNVYMVHRKDGVIKLDSTPTNKLSVKRQSHSTPTSNVLVLPSRDGLDKKVVSNTNSITPVKVISKPDGTQVVTQMKVVPKSLPANKTVIKTEPIKIQPKPEPNQIQQIHVVTSISSPGGQRSATTTASTTTTTVRPTIPRQGDRPVVSRPNSGMIRSSAPVLTGLQQRNQQQRTNTASPRQLTPQTQILQKRPTSIGTTASVTPTNKPKVTVMNSQGKVLRTTPSTPARNTLGKPQANLTPTQKMLMARNKVAQEAGKLPVKTQTKPVAGGRARMSQSNNEPGNKPKESKLAETDGLHMEFHEVESEESTSEEDPPFPPVEAAAIQPAPESPPRELTLCPLTGRLIGPDGQPVDQPEPPAPPPPAPTPMAIVTANSATDVTVATSSATAEIVLPSLDTLAEASAGGVVRVEMSPGGTTGTIVPAEPNVVVPGPDLPCLDDPNVEMHPEPVPQQPQHVVTSEGLVVPASSLAATETSILPEMETPSQEVVTVPVTAAADVGTNVKLEEAGGLVTITGEDGVVYQVTGQADDGQTLLVTRGPDGEQQCVYVTTAEQQGEEAAVGTLLTLDHAVAEAVSQMTPEQAAGTPQFYVKEGTEGATVEGGEASAQSQLVVMDNSTAVASGSTGEEGDTQVVAQVIQAEEPTAGGKRRVVLLLPDGNLMMTEVDEEQYAALELDK